jgi:hypothetical protein
MESAAARTRRCAVALVLCFGVGLGGGFVFSRRAGQHFAEGHRQTHTNAHVEPSNAARGLAFARALDAAAVRYGVATSSPATRHRPVLFLFVLLGLRGAVRSCACRSVQLRVRRAGPNTQPRHKQPATVHTQAIHYNIQQQPHHEQSFCSCCFAILCLNV